MKLLQEAWQSNPLDDWMLAATIAFGALALLMLVKLAAVQALKVLAARAGTAYAAIMIDAVSATRWWLLLPIALYTGATALDLPPTLERLVGILAVVSLMLQAALWVNRYITGWMERRVAQRRDSDGEALTALALLTFAARVVVWVITLLLILNHLSFNVTALVAGMGIGGVAVALAVQNILGDLFASLSIVLDKPFVVGDFIVVDTLRGTVERVGIKTTRLRSLDGELLVFSNADLLKSRIRNFKRMFNRRIEFTLGVAYATPLEKLRQIPVWLDEIVRAQPHTRLDRAHFKQCGDAALIFEVVYYVLDPDFNHYMDTQQSINFAVFERFEREGVEFALTGRPVYLKQEPAAQAA